MDWNQILRANHGEPPAQDYSDSITSTLYGTVPLTKTSQFPVKEHVHLGLPRDLSDVDPTVVKLLRPYL